ncbi:MAG: chemotaxis response regulator protein-glutamate methylesterase [Granulosicoccus sp.]
MINKRILVVDDSCLYQRILSDVVDAQDGLEVVGVASNGRVALNMMQRAKPDLVTLDILMPEMDGIQTLIQLRKQWPSVKTVMVSSLTSEGSDATLDALALGASEYAEKPSSVDGINSIRAGLTRDLVPKIEALCNVEVTRTPVAQTTNKMQAEFTPKRSARTATVPPSNVSGIDIVAIGVSTGGPDALAKLLSALPADFGVPIVIVQHMPAEFTGKLARRLDAASLLKVVEAQIGDKIRGGTVYIAPGGYHMTLDRIGTDVIVNLNKDEPENSCRPSVDPLFRSIPSIFGDRCLGVILTGMGADGLKGCEALSAANCPIIVQDKATSIVWGMPKLVAMAGLAQEEVALDRMAEAVIARVRRVSRLNTHAAANSDTHKHNTTSGGCA